jgi:hypothetical protein
MSRDVRPEVVDDLTVRSKVERDAMLRADLTSDSQGWRNGIFILRSVRGLWKAGHAEYVALKSKLSKKLV